MPWSGFRMAAALLFALAMLFQAGVASAQTKLTVVFPTSPHAFALPHFVALEKGWLKDAGLEVEEQWLIGDTTVIRLIVTGEADLCITGMPAAFSAVGAGAQIKAIGSHQVIFDFQMLANKNINASFGIELPVALDITGFTWNTGGDAPWAGQTVTTRDGTDAAQSGGITHSQSSWMETTVSGSGALSFYWKVSSGGGDYLEFYIDGALQTGRISGNLDWTQKTYNLTSGDHIVRWRYVKDTSGTTGSDAGWVDQVSWIPATGGFGTWLATYFTPTEIANPAIGGANADPDKDGIPNLLEYAFGRDPKNGGGSDMALGRVTPEVVKVGGNNRLRVKFTLPDAFPADLVISVEASDTLAANSWTTIATKSGAGAWTGSGTAVVGSPAATRREHGITDSTTPASGKRMARIKVSLQ